MLRDQIRALAAKAGADKWTQNPALAGLHEGTRSIVRSKQAKAIQTHLDDFGTQAHQKGWPTRWLLAEMHQGSAFARAFSTLLLMLVILGGLAFAGGWGLTWFRVFHDFERWNLVLAFLDQMFILAVVLLVLHMTYLRAQHIRSIPGGQFVPLQAAALILRWLGESSLILSLGLLGHSLLNVADPLWLSQASAFLKLGGILFSIWTLLSGFLTFTTFYATAGVIDVFLAIERHTRRSPPAENRESPLGFGQEAVQRNDPLPTP